MKTTFLMLALLAALAAGQEFAAPAPTPVIDALQPEVADLDAVTIPKLLSYQGKLTDNSGNPVPDTTYSVNFRLYTAASGGSPFWNETQTVRTKSGLFSTLLGSVTPVGSVPDAGSLYLGMAVAGGAELTPRLRIVSAAYAYKADTANYALASAGGGSGDNAWVRGTPDSVLFTVRRLGIARGAANNGLLGNNRYNHINFGYQCTTGTSGADNNNCTVGGGQANTAGGAGATVAGGGGNKATGLYATIAGGSNGAALDSGSTVGGGRYNCAPAKFATVAGGCADTTAGSYSAALSGYSNRAGGTANDTAAFVAGGYDNTALGPFSVVGGGFSNRASIGRSTVAGGSGNFASASLASVGGGAGNTAGGAWSGVGAGSGNTAGDAVADTAATVAGGRVNRAIDRYTFVGGGRENYACSAFATVAGGRNDSATGSYTTVGGGWGNVAAAYCGTVGGGLSNRASASQATVAGGNGNQATASTSTIGGGSTNTASGLLATVAGGQLNTASGEKSAVSGGASNTASGLHSMVPGGYQNAARRYSSFAGGTYARANHGDSFVWSDSAESASESLYTQVPNTFKVRARGFTNFRTTGTGLTGVWLGSGDNTWNSTSDDGHMKDSRSVDRTAVLDKVAALPLQDYRIEGQTDGVRHIGTTARDFHDALGYGPQNGINSGDVDGVLLAAVQALYEDNRALRAELEALKAGLGRR